MLAPAALAVAASRVELVSARAALTGSVAVVMTMGALHEGHAALLRQARAEADHVIATIFVNPLQFGPGEDLSRYPRTLEADLALCAEAGAKLVFAPTPDEMYPNGPPTVRVVPGQLAARLEGAHRPGHFDGVLTVVLKLLHLTRPDSAYFGEKDYQQLVLIRQMVADLDVPVRIAGVPTVREPDGLARSSRNRYLSPEQRAVALALSRVLRAGAAAAQRGEPVLPAAQAELAAAQAEPALLRLDYLELTGEDLGPAPTQGPARLLIAARVGSTRLIDNVPVEIKG